MKYKEVLLKNVSKIHTTKMGIDRIRKNLKLPVTTDPVKKCIEKLKNEESIVIKNGKNYYVTLNNEIITINSSSYTIITAHKINK